MRRGEIFRVRMPRDAWGHEQRGVRYAVVVQSPVLPLSTVLVAPTSTTALPTTFRPEVVLGGTHTRVLAEQVGVVDRGRLGRSAGHLTWEELDEVDRALETVLGLAR
ncbi:MAG: type II toxin-antitoxin system PemK/MazF family toxin [Actinobacteria bacterium]|nr:type II toxin-antitoxin system PemK/MazF family toxin [Actinomycetota bacterium]